MILKNTVHSEKQIRFTLPSTNIIMHPPDTRLSSLLVQHCPANGASTALHLRKHTQLSSQRLRHHPAPLAHTQLCLPIDTHIASSPRQAHHSALFYKPITLCLMMLSAHDSPVSESPCTVVPTHSPPAARNTSLITLNPCYVSTHHVMSLHPSTHTSLCSLQHTIPPEHSKHTDHSAPADKHCSAHHSSEFWSFLMEGSF